jgi:predicted amidohydrolase YtcJ
MRTDRRNVLGGLAALPIVAATAPYREVTVFEAHRIITMEPSQPQARFVAVADGLILSVADSLAALAPWTDGRNVNLDRRFAGKILMPGLIEPHLHPMQAAVMLNLPFVAPDDWELPSASFPGARTPEAWRLRFRQELVRSTDPLFVCWGYHALFHGPLDRAELDRIVDDRPVVIWQRSFHDVIINTRAMEAWGIASRSEFDAVVARAKADPAHCDFDRGHLSESGLPIALEKMRSHILTAERVQNGMVALKRIFLSKGITTASDMATGIFANFETEAGLIKAAFEQPGCSSRVMLMPFANGMTAEADPVSWLKTIEQRFAGRHVRVDKRIKLFADGAFFAQNMRMNAPGYSDGHHGKWITEPDSIRHQMQTYWELGFSLHVHVNGDEGLDVVLEAIEALPLRMAQTITLEHLGYSTEAQNRRIARLGLMVSAQPNYIRVLGDAYARGLGSDRAAVMNRLGSLEHKGVPLGLHSDFNMAPIDPLYLAWVAATRETIGGNIKAPGERISLDKAMRAITIEAAQVIGMDHIVGSIAVGKKADFAVLDRDPFRVGVAGLPSIHLEGVIFEGEFAAS